jgi:zinc-binding alcohol dehydrogenase/oxidoreductase
MNGIMAVTHCINFTFQKLPVYFMQGKMKAAHLNPDTFRFQTDEVAMPSKGDDEVLIQVKAASINHHELWTLKEKPALENQSRILGSDGAGIIAGAGSAVSNFKAGDKVIINPSINWGTNPRVQGPRFEILGDARQGTFAEYISVHQRYIHHLPGHLSFEEAAAIPLAGLTAYRALFTRGEVGRNNKVLITGIGGGAALFALTFAVAAGAEVFVTSGDQSKIQKAIGMGANGGVNYKENKWQEGLKETAGGFDVIIDSAAGKGFADLAALANPGARIVLFGRTAGMIPGLDPKLIFWKQLSIHGSTMGTEKEFSEMIAFVNEKKIRPVIDSVFALNEIHVAFAKMDTGNHFGKLVLTL